MKSFALRFIAVLLIYYALTAFPCYSKYIAQPVASFYAKVTQLILALVGIDDISRNHTRLDGVRYSMDIAEGCDAIAPLVIVWSAIILFPYASVASKKKGLFIAGIYIVILNLIRLISLYTLGVYKPNWFEFFHVEVWQTLFILFSIAYFFYWLKYQIK